MSLIDKPHAIPIATTAPHCPSCTCKPPKNPVAPLPIDHGFAEFWANYPQRRLLSGVLRKGHRAKTLQHWKTLTLERRRVLYKAARNYAVGQDPRYIKDSQRFLSEDFWRDWVDVEIGDAVTPPRPPGASNKAKYDPTKGQWTG